MEVSRSTKLTVLALLVIQNASSALMMRYSRGVRNETYATTSAVIVSEIVKLCTCMLLIVFGVGESGLNGYANNKYASIASKVQYLVSNSGYTWVPATCYFVQNSLMVVASGNLSAAVYGTLQQLKILSAALFSVFILGRRIAMFKWRALLLLVLGGILIEYHTFTLHESAQLTNANDPFKGTVAMLTVVSISGFAGVMTELLLKNKKLGKEQDLSRPNLSIWDRNIQLAFWSIIFGFVAYIVEIFMVANADVDNVTETSSFFNGWTLNTCILVGLWASGGLLVAFTIKYTNVIIKGFASAISLILMCIGGYVLLNDALDVIFLVGAGVTILATFNYNDTGDSTRTMSNAKPPTPENYSVKNSQETQSLMAEIQQHTKK